MKVSVKSNAVGLHARLNNVRRNTQQFSMILIFACAFFIDLQALQFRRTLGFGKCTNGLLLSQLEIPCNSSVFLAELHL